jgi:hypothetical protein
VKPASHKISTEYLRSKSTYFDAFDGWLQNAAKNKLKTIKAKEMRVDEVFLPNKALRRRKTRKSLQRISSNRLYGLPQDHLSEGFDASPLDEQMPIAFSSPPAQRGGGAVQEG